MIDGRGFQENSLNIAPKRMERYETMYRWNPETGTRGPIRLPKRLARIDRNQHDPGEQRILQRGRHQ